MKDFAQTEEFKILSKLDCETQFLSEWRDYQYKDLQQTELEWVGTREQLDQAVQEIESTLNAKHNVMAVDLEYNGVCKMGTVLSLIQISTVDKDYIIDALIMRDNTWYAGLRSLMENPKYVKILHGGDSDVQLLATDLDICCLNVFDTARAYQYLQKLPQLYTS